MTTQPVNKTAKSIMEEFEKRVLSDWPVVDYAAYKGIAKSATLKTRNPVEVLRDYSNSWATFGVSCPDLVFQTRSQGQHFYASCLAAVGTYPLGGSPGTPDKVDGMCIARVMGVNLIWPEE